MNNAQAISTDLEPSSKENHHLILPHSAQPSTLKSGSARKTMVNGVNQFHADGTLSFGNAHVDLRPY